MSERSPALVVSRWLGHGNRTSLEVSSMVVTWWIAAFCEMLFYAIYALCLSIVADRRDNKQFKSFAKI